VTDAHILLGRLDEQHFLGGAMALDQDAARSAIAGLAGQLGLSELEAAEGIVTILNSNMANAIRSRTVQKGIDPRAYSLVAFGGAGPLHGAEVARMLGIPECIIPAYPGITSAVGLLTTDVKYDAIRTAFQVSTAFDTVRLHDAFDAMQAELSGQFTDAGTDPESVGFERFADVRYVGQGYELRIPVPDGRLNAAALDTVVQRFHRRHESEYGHFFADSPIEIVTVRLVGIGRAPKIDALSYARPDASEPTGAGSLQRALLKTQPSVFRVNQVLRHLDTAFYRREDLPLDDPVAGPAVIVQTDSTTLIPPDCRFRLDPHRNLIIEIGVVA
jgi:N-methylhydantoinase A